MRFFFPSLWDKYNYYLLDYKRPDGRIDTVALGKEAAKEIKKRLEEYRGKELGAWEEWYIKKKSGEAE